MANLNGSTPSEIAAKMIETPSLQQHINNLAKELGVPREKVEAYIKQQAYRKAYAKRRNEEFKVYRQLVKADSSLREQMGKAVDLVEVK